jgi:hypothetical protein
MRNMETPERTTQTGTNDTEAIGRAAYEGYGDSLGWQTYDGGTMPPWDAQDEKRKAGWRAAAARAVRAAADGSVEHRG